MSLQETRRTYDRAAAWYDDDLRGGAFRRKLRFRIIEGPMRKLLESGGCLDLGCGTGRLLGEIRSQSPNVGMDLSMGMLRKADPGRSELCLADAHRLPVADSSFSSVISSNGVFRYLRTQEAFAECHRVLKPGGKLAVHQYSQKTWSRPRLGKKAHPVDMRHLSSLTDLTAPAEQAGFATENAWLWRSVRFFPFALPIAQALPGAWWSHAVALFSKSELGAPL